MDRIVLSLFACAVVVSGACGGGSPPTEDPGGSGGVEAEGGSRAGGAPGRGGSPGHGGAPGAGGRAAPAGDGGSSGDGGSPGAGGAPGGGGSAADAAATGAGGSDPTGADAGTPVAPDPQAPCPRCVRAFNGTSFEGWEASAATWKIVDGAMHGEGGTSRTAYTKQDYGNFRLIFTTRMNPVNGDHLGILMWGNRPTTPDKPEINNAGWLQWMPNYGGLWGYWPPKDRGVPSTKVAPSPTDWTQWHTCELLMNLDKGTLRAATDGVEVSRYTHPYPTERTDPMKRIIKGPIGMMKHGGGGSEYKDIFIEVDPTEDKLYTVK